MPSTRQIAIASVLVAACAAAWYSWTYAWLPEGASTVSLLHAADTFHQCSRAAPFTRPPYWVPTASQIREIDPALPALARQPPPGYLPPAVGTRFTRQYIGFTRAGKRFVYVNVVVDDWGIGERGWQENVLHFADLLLPERPVLMCDGGNYAWGVVYDLGAKKFEPPRFNGRA